MKIFVIDEEFPYPPNTGKRIRTYNLISRIAGNHELYYMAYGEEDSASFRKFHENNLHPIAVKSKIPAKSGLMFYFRLLGNLLSKYPYVVTSHFSNEFKNQLIQNIEKIKPDIIICEWTPYALYVKDIERTKKVIVAHNIESLIWKRYFENEQNPFKKWYINLQYKKMEKFEKASFSWVDGATAVSSIEEETIKNIENDIDVITIENGVDLEYFHPAAEEPKANQLVFVGSMNWRPNQDAITFFVEDILPILKTKVPDINVRFVGRNPSPELLKYNEIPGVEIIGDVDDVRPHIYQSSVYIVPLRIGGGTRLKILEALSMKKAVVSTTIGAEGLMIADNENILLADTPEDFASKVSSLLSNNKLIQKLGENGRLLVEENYGWDKISDKFEKYLQEIVNGK